MYRVVRPMRVLMGMGRWHGHSLRVCLTVRMKVGCVPPCMGVAGNDRMRTGHGALYRGKRSICDRGWNNEGSMVWTVRMVVVCVVPPTEQPVEPAGLLDASRPPDRAGVGRLVVKIQCPSDVVQPDRPRVRGRSPQRSQGVVAESELDKCTGYLSV